MDETSVWSWYKTLISTAVKLWGHTLKSWTLCFSRWVWSCSKIFKQLMKYGDWLVNSFEPLLLAHFLLGYCEDLIHKLFAIVQQDDVTYNLNILVMWACFTKNPLLQRKPKIELCYAMEIRLPFWKNCFFLQFITCDRNRVSWEEVYNKAFSQSAQVKGGLFWNHCLNKFFFRLKWTKVLLIFVVTTCQPIHACCQQKKVFGNHF